MAHSDNDPYLFPLILQMQQVTQVLFFNLNVPSFQLNFLLLLQDKRSLLFLRKPASTMQLPFSCTFEKKSSNRVVKLTATTDTFLTRFLSQSIALQ